MDKPTVKLVGIDGNAFVILGAVSKAIKQFYTEQGNKRKGARLAKEYQEEATSGDYDHLLQTTMKYCELT